MTNSSVFVIVDSVFNLISFFIDIIAVLICIIYLCVIIYRFIEFKCQHRRITIDVSLILSINIICTIFIKSTLQIIHVTIPTLMKDFQITTTFEETTLCRVRAYILWSIIGVLYWNYVLLAFFRFVRVVYSTKVWLHRASLYLYILIPAQFLFVFIGMSPLLLVFDGIHLLLNEAYCGILIKPIYFLIYESSINFGIPYNAICIFYIWIRRKMRQSPTLRVHNEHNRKDYIVIRRMLLNTVILCIVTIPYIVLYMINLFHNDFELLIHPVQWLSSSISSCLFSLTLPLITTQLHNLLKPNRLTPIHHQTQIHLKNFQQKPYQLPNIQ